LRLQWFGIDEIAAVASATGRDPAVFVTILSKRVHMKQAKVLLTVLIVLASTRVFGGQMTPPQPAKTPGEAIDRALSIVERQFTSAADAMPEDKYSFAPTSGEFKGVRTFAQQVKHVASTNYFSLREFSKKSRPSIQAARTDRIRSRASRRS
jgi:hypothetical protein